MLTYCSLTTDAMLLTVSVRRGGIFQRKRGTAKTSIFMSIYVCVCVCFEGALMTELICLFITL